MKEPTVQSQIETTLRLHESMMWENPHCHYNKSDFFQGSKPLKKVLKNLEKNYFKSPIDPW